MSMNAAIVVGRGLFISEGNPLDNKPPYTVNLDRSDGYWIIPYDSYYENELEEFLLKHNFVFPPEMDMTQKGKIKRITERKKSNCSSDVSSK